MRHFAVSAIGRDRPGIVAAMSEVLLDHEANIEDSQMTILGGHFTMTLVVAAPATVDRDALAAGLEQAAARLDLEAVSISDLEELAGTARAQPSHVLSVYGIDHPGIVHAVSSTLAEHQASITDLTTKVLAGEGDAPIYTMMLEVQLPDGADAARIEQALLETAARQEVEISFRPLEQDAL
jgi:glycine cleavage system transcriptional repressor